MVEDVRVAITCCAVLNFLPSLMTSSNVWGTYLYIFTPVLCAFKKAFNNGVDTGNVPVKTAPLGFCFTSVYIGCQGSIVPLLDFHVMCMFSLQTFKYIMLFMFSQDFSARSALKEDVMPWILPDIIANFVDVIYVADGRWLRQLL